MNDAFDDFKNAVKIIGRQHYTGKILSVPISKMVAEYIKDKPELMDLYHKFDYAETCFCENPEQHKESK